MPNGGSDCCGTCWFNRTNRGQRDWSTHRDRTIPPFCEIRNLALENPFYTYCANHPHRRPNRDSIPIGPVMRGDSDPSSNRWIWEASPDTEEIRQHLLDLLDNWVEAMLRDYYPIGIGLAETVVRQLGEFREQRAAGVLEEISQRGPGILTEAAREALAEIRGVTNGRG